MSLFTTHRPDFLASGERARLIPVNAATSKEGRLTSCFLAAFMSVDEFAKGLLASVGVRLGKTSKVECYTEVVFKNKDRNSAKIRPDGLIVITTGNKRWSALIEAKVGNAEHQCEQVENYLDLAKENKIDAVITLSNQFSATPTHHPICVNKTKIRSVSLFHWSWTYLIAEAVMWVKYHGVNDPDQAYILEELVRFLQHDSSGVSSFDRMNASWKDVCGSVQNRITLKKNSTEVQESVGSWHQFVRNISLHLSLSIGEDVTVYLKKAHKDDALKRLEDDASQLVSEQTLTADFDIPHAADRIKFTADIETRSMTVCMRLKAPEERATTKGRINWFLGQLKKTTDDSISVRVAWPSRAPDTMATLAQIKEKGIDILLSDNSSLKPIAFEAVLTRDLGAKFKGAKTFVQLSEPLLLEFYEQAGQHLKEWVAAPPKVRTKNAEALIENADAEEVEPQTAADTTAPSSTAA